MDVLAGLIKLATALVALAREVVRAKSAKSERHRDTVKTSRAASSS